MRQAIRTQVFFVALLALLGPVSDVLARGTVNIKDDAGVLSSGDQQTIQQAAQSAPFDVTVWMAKGGYANNKRSFNDVVNGQASGGRVVIGVDPTDHWVHIATRQNTGLTAGETTQAEQGARQSFTQRDWGGGVSSMIRSLAQVAPAAGSRNTNRSGRQNSMPTNAAPVYRDNNSSGGGFNFGGLLLIAVVIGGLVVLARRLMGGGKQPIGYGPGYNPTINQPGGVNGPGGMNQGYGPGGGYPQGGYQQGNQGRGGMGGLMAGGIGAVGGGLLGYELGKSAGEHENQQQGYSQNDGGGYSNDPGGLVQSDDGSNNSPDFGDPGGGGGDFGGGGDSGGGGGDF